MRKLFSLLVVLLLVCSVASCGEKQSDTIKIGSSGPLSGSVSIYGQAVEAGVKLAIEEINAADWVRYSSLVTDEDVEAVKKMGVMLRLAEALDRSGMSSVSNINCDILGDSVIMKTEVVGDATLEINAANSLAGDFRRVFKKNLEIL